MRQRFGWCAVVAPGVVDLGDGQGSGSQVIDHIEMAVRDDGQPPALVR
jgi:hypothetical protein